jgi:hypothetical protein
MLLVYYFLENRQMATKNPRVVGYIQPENHAKLRQFMDEHDVTESKALDLILGEYFGVDVPRVTLGSTPDVDSKIDEAIAPLKQELEEIKLRLGSELGELTAVLSKKRAA